MRRALLLSCGCAALLAAPAIGQSLVDRIDHAALRGPRDRVGLRTRHSTLRALLTTRMTLRTRDAAAIDVLDAIRSATGVTLVVRVRSDWDYTGMDGEHPVTIDVVDAPAIDVLEIVLEACSFDRECTWQLRGSVVEVGTKVRLAVSTAQEIRYYAVRDLLFEVPDYGNAPPFDLDSALGQSGGSGGGGGDGGSEGGALIIGTPGEEPARRDEETQGQLLVDLIRSVIEPDGWRDNGGDWASIRLYQGTLIVRAPDFIHRQIRRERVVPVY